MIITCDDWWLLSVSYDLMNLMVIVYGSHWRDRDYGGLMDGKVSKAIVDYPQIYHFMGAETMNIWLVHDIALLISLWEIPCFLLVAGFTSCCLQKKKWHDDPQLQS